MPSGRWFGLAVARLTAATAAGVLLISVIAGLVRVLPLVLADGVPLRLAPVLARAVAGVALETALFVAPPIGWALAASRLVDRGEARALFALGVRPARIVAEGWPAALGVAAAAAVAAGLWGREASAPGRALRDLLAEARASCVSAPSPAVADVPLVGVSWVCLEGAPPRVVGPAPSGEGAFGARALDVSDDLRALDARDLELLIPRTEAHPEARVLAAVASIRGLSPIGRASNLAPIARAILLASTATALAALAAGIALVRSVRGRAAAFALGALGPVAALLVFSALERGPSPGAAYGAVPAAGLVALVAAWLAVRTRRTQPVDRARSR